jgi:hypothetical protein
MRVPVLVDIRSGQAAKSWLVDSEVVASIEKIGRHAAINQDCR